jgi:hypothetical protein
MIASRIQIAVFGGFDAQTRSQTRRTFIAPDARISQRAARGRHFSAGAKARRVAAEGLRSSKAREGRPAARRLSPGFPT